MDSSEWYQLLAGAFHVITDKIEADILETGKKKMELKMNLYTSRILFQKDSRYKYQFCTKVCAPLRLGSEVWAKYKDVPTKLLKHHAIINSI